MTRLRPMCRAGIYSKRIKRIKTLCFVTIKNKDDMAFIRKYCTRCKFWAGL